MEVEKRMPREYWNLIVGRNIKTTKTA